MALYQNLQIRQDQKVEQIEQVEHVLQVERIEWFFYFLASLLFGQNWVPGWSGSNIQRI